MAYRFLVLLLFLSSVSAECDFDNNFVCEWNWLSIKGTTGFRIKLEYSENEEEEWKRRSQRNQNTLSHHKTISLTKTIHSSAEQFDKFALAISRNSFGVVVDVVVVVLIILVLWARFKKQALSQLSIRASKQMRCLVNGGVPYKHTRTLARLLDTLDALFWVKFNE